MQNNYSLQGRSSSYGYRAHANIIMHQHLSLPRCSMNMCANRRLRGLVYINTPRPTLASTPTYDATADSRVRTGLQRHG